MRAEELIMTLGFGFIGLMLGVGAVVQGGKPLAAVLVFAAGGLLFGAFLGVWGSVEPDER